MPERAEMGTPVKIIDPQLLKRFRRQTRCEWCKEPTPACEAHHLFQRGAGGWSRFDIPINLMGLCAGIGTPNCHGAYHSTANILQCDLLAVVAQRENLMQDQIMEAIRLLKRGERRWTPDDFPGMPWQKWEGLQEKVKVKK